jgi:peptide deformylase
MKKKDLSAPVALNRKTDPSTLDLVRYPDPRLRKKTVEVKDYDAWLRQVAGRMFEVMYANRGVGLAAPQVGLSIRLFVCNQAGKPADGQEIVFVNPVLSDLAGAEECEEGCLSLPGVNGLVLRATRCRIRAYDVAGKPVEQVGEGLLARIWQHEVDHLDGVLLPDRFAEAALIANRRALRDLEEEHSLVGKGKR